MKFGDKMTMLRKQKNISQVELAEKKSISRDAISKYERGDIVPSVEYANALPMCWALAFVTWLVGMQRKMRWTRKLLNVSRTYKNCLSKKRKKYRRWWMPSLGILRPVKLMLDDGCG
jgi:DNA-binding XRE family transcriptional regulator